MKENKDMPAFPVLELQHRGDKLMLDRASDGLSKREMIAAQMDVRNEVADYSIGFLEKLIGRERPSSATPYEMLAWDAEIEAKMRVIKADALLAELSKS